MKYTGNAATYITNFTYNEQGEAFAKSVEKYTSYFVQVDIWTKDEFEDLYKQVLALMMATGDYCSCAHELYESDTQIKHKVIRF